MIKALIFDFDGLILDTESPEYQSWQEIYQEHGCSLSLSKWAESIGISSVDAFDPCDYLEQQLGQSVDREAIRARHHARFDELIAMQSLLPGVEDYIFEAKKLGLKLGLASSSSRAWVTRYLSRFRIHTYFDALRCADDVERAKPDPALYLAALQALGVEAHEAIALEDSPNGVLAAKRAGIFCVAVPNALTRQLSLDLADLQLASLAELPLEKLLRSIAHLSPTVLPDAKPTWGKRSNDFLS
jgi:HAD superfamily hydrolase (TIGR01509 family)